MAELTESLRARWWCSSLAVQYPNTTLVKIDGLKDRKSADFYLGKRVAYVYRGQKEINGTKIRVIWGTIARPHGNNGVVRVRFQKAVPPRAFGATVRVMLYPSRV